jgi:SAM-dependent methyltransferase
MSPIPISNKLKADYDNYFYTKEGELEWRELSSIDKVKNILYLCETIRHESTLEVGCGEGAILKRLSGLNFSDNLYGLEISPTAMDLVKEKDIGSLVECKLFDGYNIPYDDSTFNLVILTHVVEHLEYPRKLLDEAGRVADYVFVEVPLEDHYRLKKNYVYDKVGHINVYSPKTIRWLMQTSGFDVLKQIVTIPGYAVFRHSLGRKALLVYPPLKAAVQFFPAVATQFFTYHCALLCKKVISCDCETEYC